MVLNIDIPTILFSLAMINFSAVVLILLQTKFSRAEVDLDYFIINKLLQGVAWLFHAILFTTPDSPFLVFVQLIFILGVGFESALFTQFKGNMKGNLKVAMVAIALLLSVSTSLVRSSIEMREVVMGLSYMFYVYLIAGNLIFRKDSTTFQIRLGLFYAIFPIVSSLLYHSLRSEVADGVGDTSLGGLCYYVILIFMQLVGSVGYLLMVLEAYHLKNQERTRELQAALDDVATLSGLIPICASCSKTRDDDGYWEKLEVHLQKHTHLDFSHSLCPDCVALLYPDIKLGDQQL